MGWVNCGDKYLAKYSDLLSKLGVSSVRTVQPALTGFAIAESPRRLWATNILEFVLEIQERDRYSSASCSVPVRQLEQHLTCSWCSADQSSFGHSATAAAGSLNSWLLCSKMTSGD